MVKRLFVFLAFLVVTQSQAAIINIACSFNALTNAFAIANDGDTINIAAGSDVWQSGVILSSHKSLNIQGAGSGIPTGTYATPCGSFTIGSQTPGAITTFTGSGINAFWIQNMGTNTHFTVAHINFAIAPGASHFMFSFGPNVPTANIWDPRSVWHVYDCAFTNANAQHMIFTGFAESYGLLDHCLFWIPVGAANWTALQSQGNGFFSWTNQTLALGTTNCSVFENNVLINQSSSAGNGFYDGYSGGKEMIRDNYFDGGPAGGASNGSHGYDSGDTAVIMAEIGCNTFTNWNGGLAFAQTRGGLFQIYSNTVYYTNPSVTITSVYAQLEYHRGSVSEDYQSYTYQGTYQTNWWFTNNDTVTADGYLVTNIWWDRFQSNGAGYFHLDSTSTNVTAAHSAQLLGANTWTPTQPFVAYGNIKYTYTTNLSLASPAAYIKYGTNMAETIINTASMLNSNYADAGIRWSAFTTNGYLFTGFNHDVWVPFYSSNYMVLQNRMDGTNTTAIPGSQTGIGYQGAMQPGTYWLTLFTNNPIGYLPSYQWSNTVVSNGVTLASTIKFIINSREFSSNGVVSFITNTLVEGRDFSNDVVAPYTTLVFPHPMQADESTAPIFTTQPQSQTICVSSNATFTIAVTGTAPFTYQWYNGISPIANATNTSMTLSNNTVSTTVYCAASNPGGTTSSSTATLTVQNCIPYVGADGFSGAVIIQGAVNIDK